MPPFGGKLENGRFRGYAKLSIKEYRIFISIFLIFFLGFLAWPSPRENWGPFVNGQYASIWRKT
jgi:hypothetical protein